MNRNPKCTDLHQSCQHGASESSGSTAVTGAERRTFRRFELSFPARVRDRSGALAQTETSTRDICARGLYFTVAQEYEVGSKIECILTLPPECCQGHTVLVRCRGKVVRLERQAPGRIGVGATIESYEFLNAG